MTPSTLELHFETLWDELFPDIDLYAEYRFIPPRRFRFDFACPDSKVAIECQGGIWTQGRHSRGSGLMSEYEKLSLAASQGWLVFLLSREMINENWLGAIATTIKERLS